jgi:hypothetical protein
MQTRRADSVQIGERLEIRRNVFLVPGERQDIDSFELLHAGDGRTSRHTPGAWLEAFNSKRF